MLLMPDPHRSSRSLLLRVWEPSEWKARKSDRLLRKKAPQVIHAHHILQDLATSACERQ